ncbi:DinB family protein [Neobacillus sp. PS3-34]|uniref:DinB family protein n=1 Tax=Neobacillus sp. PS3-34 TaxID=3070678 RepID=UPI0027E08993|nr:DinB family protein [Neobacillus sp. PS3-34]WML48598.1 DinB family protein [Neobacillus sp. PS3-34]
MNQKEYEWVKETRAELLNFCRELEPNDFTRQLDGFGFQSIRDTLIHIADCYHAWLGSFVLLKTKKPLTPKENRGHVGIEEITKRFEQADAYVNKVFEVHSQNMDEHIHREIPWRDEGEILSLTPDKLLTHTITHEFHHKGQVVTMARQLGYQPPNTDVLGTRD